MQGLPWLAVLWGHIPYLETICFSASFQIVENVEFIFLLWQQQQRQWLRHIFHKNKRSCQNTTRHDKWNLRWQFHFVSLLYYSLEIWKGDFIHKSRDFPTQWTNSKRMIQSIALTAAALQVHSGINSKKVQFREVELFDTKAKIFFLIFWSL